MRWHTGTPTPYTHTQINATKDFDLFKEHSQGARPSHPICDKPVTHRLEESGVTVPQNGVAPSKHPCLLNQRLNSGCLSLIFSNINQSEKQRQKCPTQPHPRPHPVSYPSHTPKPHPVPEPSRTPGPTQCPTQVPPSATAPIISTSIPWYLPAHTHTKLN